MNLINNRMTYRIVRDLRSQAIRHIQVLPLSHLDQHSSGDIVSRVIADTDILSDGLRLDLYTAVLRHRNHYCDTVFHVLEERMDHPSCDLPDTSGASLWQNLFPAARSKCSRNRVRREENRPHSSMR